jgi:hypothetical protein
MYIVIDGKITEFDPVYNLHVYRQTTKHNGQNLCVHNDNAGKIKQVAVNDILGGYWWWPISKTAEIEAQLARRGLGLFVHDSENDATEYLNW